MADATTRAIDRVLGVGGQEGAIDRVLGVGGPDGPRAPSGPQQAGFLESLPQVGERAGRFLTSLGPPSGRRAAFVGAQKLDQIRAAEGDFEAAKRVRAGRTVLAAATSVLPGGRAIVAGKGVARALASRAAFGAAGGGVAAGADAAAAGDDVPSAVLGGAAVGAVLNPAVGAVMGRVARFLELRAVERLRRSGKPVPDALARRAAVIEASPEIVPSTPVQRVLQSIRAVPRVRARQEKLQSVELARRIERAEKAAKGLVGPAAIAARSRELKGALTRVDFEALKIDDADAMALFRQIEGSGLRFFERHRADIALQKLFGDIGGKIPQPAELTLLGRVFGNNFVQEILNKRSTLIKGKELGLELINLPRALRATSDLSGTLRQALFLGIGSPKRFGQAFVQQLRVLTSEKAFQEQGRLIAARPTFEFMEKGKLAITDLGPVLTNREEVIMSRLPEKIPGFGRVVRASNRAMTGLLRQIRADVFDDLWRVAERTGLNPAENPVVYNDMAKFINSASGRGSSRFLERNAATLNTLFFSPRLIQSRIDLLNPGFYHSLHPLVRKQAMRSVIGMTVGATIMGGMAVLAGGAYELDPRESSFGQMRFGKLRIDLGGGLNQFMRDGARLLNNTARIATGEPVLQEAGQAGATIGRATLNKLNPPVRFAVDIMSGGRWAFSQPFNPASEGAKLFIPIAAEDAAEAVQEYGPAGLALTPISVLGAGVQIFE